MNGNHGIVERTNAKGVVAYQAQIRLRGEKPIFKSHATLDDALLFQREVRRQIAEHRQQAAESHVPQPPDGDLSKEALATTLRLFVASKRAKTRHKDEIPTVLKHIGAVTIGELGNTWAENFIDRMRSAIPPRRNKPYAEKTIRGFVGVVRTALAWRARRLNVPKPLFDIDPDLFAADVDVVRERRLSRVEEAALLRALRARQSPSRAHWACLLRLALASGARLQEMLRADWRHVDFGTRIWTIPAEKTKGKTRRSVPMSSQILRIMARLRADAQDGNPAVFHRLVSDLAREDISDSVSSMFWLLTRKLGIVDLRFHDLRHEAIVRFVKGARTPADIVKIMKVVGHKNYETFDRYITFHDTELLGALSR